MFRTFRRPVRAASLLASVLLAAGAPFATALAATGDRENGFDCEALVQAVYWDQRNEGRAGTFPLEQYRDVLAQRAERTARLVTWLRDRRGRDLTASDLEGEIARMARDTKAPETLKALFAALGDDPRTIGECLAKPVLVERLARQYFERDEAIHAPVRARAGRELAAARAGTAAPMATLARVPLIEARQSDRVANPAATAAERDGVRLLREFNVVEWQIAPDAPRTRWSALLEDESTLRALRGDYVDGRLVLRELRWPKATLEAWLAAHAGDIAPDYAAKAIRVAAVPQLAAGEPAGWDRVRDIDRFKLDGGHAITVSTGTEVIFWGGSDGYAEREVTAGAYSLNRGAAYNPATDSWRFLPMAGAPAVECGTLRGVWTGSRLVVTVGECWYTKLDPNNDDDRKQSFHGAAYDPVADAWQPIAAPPASWRPGYGYTVVWTGSKAIYFGGAESISLWGLKTLATGAIYDPATNAWTAYTVTPAQAGLTSSDRYRHQAIWTGTTMMVFGGTDSLQRCDMAFAAFSFNPFTGVGAKLPDRQSGDKGPFGHVHWDGAKVLVWGSDGPHAYNCGQLSYNFMSQRYDPVSGTWALLSGPNVPVGQGPSVLVGNRLVVWSGASNGGVLQTGGATYRSDTSTWTPMATAGAPRPRVGHQAVAIGNEALFLGGSCPDVACGDSKRYDAVANAWRAVALPPPEDGPPLARLEPATAGSASEIYVWGGHWRHDPDPVTVHTDGAMYDSVVDSWAALGTSGAPSARSGAFSTFASGKLLVWGGRDPATNAPRGDGKLYDPVARTWTAMAAPPMDLARTGAAIAWDGTRLIIWGGSKDGVAKNDGARYNPAINAWSVLATANAPSARSQPLVVANAGKTFVWRGAGGATGGAIYTASSNTWAPVPENGSFPAGTFDASGHTAVWLGDRFGVLRQDVGPNALLRLDNATTGQWLARSTDGAPTGPAYAVERTALWTGKHLLVWGLGNGTGGGYPPYGWLYAPATDTWALAPAEDAPRIKSMPLFRMGTRTAAWGGGTNTGSLWHEDTRTPPVEVDVGVEVRFIPTPPDPNQYMYMDVVATNHGTEIASRINLELVLGGGFGWDKRPTGEGTCTENLWYPAEQPVYCVIDTLAPGESRTIHTVVRFAAYGDDYFDTTLGARVRSTGELDTVPANDHSLLRFPVLTFHSPNIVEGDAGSKQLASTATLSNAVTWPVTFRVATSDWEATAGEDYEPIDLEITIPAGQLAATYAVTILGDTDAEQNEYVGRTITELSGAMQSSSGEGLIINDDGVTFSVGDASVVEGDSGDAQMRFTATLSQPSTEQVRFTYDTHQYWLGSATVHEDYEDQYYNSVVFEPGETSKTFDVAVHGDVAAEANETLLLDFSNITAATAFTQRATGTILNDDGPVLAIADVSLAEGNSGTRPATFTATLSQASADAVTFDVATASGTATSGTDYVPMATTTLTIPAGATSMGFTVLVKGDTAIEASETFHVDLANVQFATITDTRATATILGDDGPGVSIADVKVIEGASGTRTATFTVKLSKTGTVPVTYDIATANGTATAGSDYVAKALAGETIPAGTLSRTFSVTLQGDGTVEDNETFTVTLANVAGGFVLDGQATGTIVNDDGPTLSISDVQVIEGASGQAKAIFVVRLSQVAAVPVTYSIATGNGTATTANADYIARALVGETIPAGQLTRNFIINVNGDAAIEANEGFVAVLSNSTGASIYDAQAAATILNDDGPTLSIGDASVSEGASGLKTLTFTVSLSQAATAPVRFDFATADGTATTANADYVARTSLAQNLPAGVTSKTFGVSVRGDAVVEPNETFVVNLTNASGPATVLDPQATGTISNDD